MRLASLFTGLGFSLFAFAAFGASISCHGSRGSGQVTVRADLDDRNKIVGDVDVVYSSGRGFGRDWRLTPTSQDIRAHKVIKFSAYNRTGSTVGTLDTTYDAGKKAYLGQLVAKGRLGSIELPVSCELQSSR